MTSIHLSNFTCLWLLLLSASFSVAADEVLVNSIAVTEITSIYDGDTFRATIDEWPEIIGLRIPIRVKNIDTPELRGQCRQEKVLARKAKQFTVQTLRNGKTITIENVSRGKFFRLVADVSVDGDSLGEELLKKGLAVAYDGTRKKFNWCEGISG